MGFYTFIKGLLKLFHYRIFISLYISKVFNMHYIELATVALIFFFHFKVIVLSPGPYPFINTAAHSSGETSRETSSSTE